MAFMRMVGPAETGVATVLVDGEDPMDALSVGFRPACPAVFFTAVRKAPEAGGYTVKVTDRDALMAMRDDLTAFLERTANGPTEPTSTEELSR